MDLRKNKLPKKRTRLKNRTSRTKIKALPFVSSYIKDNIQIIHFHIECTRPLFHANNVGKVYTKFLNFYVKRGEVDTKTTIANL